MQLPPSRLIFTIKSRQANAVEREQTTKQMLERTSIQANAVEREQITKQMLERERGNQANAGEREQAAKQNYISE